MRNAKATKERIGRTALRLFVERGVKETTIRDIAAGAGVAEGAMYRHYASKDELAWALFSENLIAFALELEEIRRAQPTLVAQNDAMIRRFCNFFDEDPILFSYLLLAQNIQHRSLPPDMPDPFNVVRDTIADGMSRGDIPRADPELVASMVFGLLRQVAVSRVAGRITASLTDCAGILVDATWRVMHG